MRNSTYCLEIGQGVKSLRGSDRGFDCRLTVVRPSYFTAKLPLFFARCMSAKNYPYERPLKERKTHQFA